MPRSTSCLSLARKSTSTEAKVIRSTSALYAFLSLETPRAGTQGGYHGSRIAPQISGTLLSPLCDNPVEAVLFRCHCRRKKNKQAISKDLVRLEMLTKNAIDQWSIQGCLAIQIVATFYMAIQLSPELHTLLKQSPIRLPSFSCRPSRVSQSD
ncbi:uncharacterized protein BYT42DRAFT_326253 [Radiomyces spectabilis]|uniref:uncharacterized protein n=1 Tax=Radiomyces spectabilis TaxID=64574 RepID=UPI0022208F51|nr:uncharacterized protein BYT42DRAFT_326253 [Radiomyces spectabilis]KAI8379421.1 hypothetical protein BYT42DRAFT_326253 [Radiomyces spectabilis]